MASALLAGALLGGCGGVLAGAGGAETKADAAPAEAASTATSTTLARGVEGAVCVADPTSLEEVEVPLYFRSADDERTVKLYFADEGHEIPYLDTDTMRTLLEDVTPRSTRTPATPRPRRRTATRSP